MAKHVDAIVNVQRHGCCAVVEEAAARSREKREARRNMPQPWIMLKLGVIITLALFVYTSYVYIGRLCVPMIKRERGAFGGRARGSESFLHDSSHRWCDD